MNDKTRKRRRSEACSRIGTIVRSHYRAGWTGIVIAHDESVLHILGRGDIPSHCVIVRITHDRRGKSVPKPLSKRWIVVIDPGWLKPIKVSS